MRPALLLLPMLSLGMDIDVLPTPHYLEPLATPVRFPAGADIPVRLSQPRLQVAQQMLAEGCPDVRFASAAQEARVFLWDYSTSRSVAPKLNFLDRQLLEESPLRGQSYVLRTDGDSVWVVGGGPAGVLYGAATLAQLVHRTDSAVEVPGVYIRDYPDFQYRAAADWLLAVEVNRWALDRGRGLTDYGRLVRKELDRAARYKINVALIDGFGWSLEARSPGYAPLMRALNRYARDRGILLQFGGYGAAYDIAQQPNEYQGTVFLNRESYPGGRVYQCLAFPERKGGMDPRTMGTCRGNDELNRLKGENLAHFVDAIEPGVLYIHHEDCCVFEDYQKAWLGRCERCRRRWPNDSLLAADGGAGALAHGYSALIEAVNRVEHPDTGYRASRDTQITLVSPVYMPSSARSEDWGHVLELWRIIARLLPHVQNVQICFREILPQPGGGRRWVELFNSAMEAEQLPFGAYVFVVGGGDGFLSDYPTTGVPAMNAHFRGARTIYNATGDFYHQPLQVVAAEYSWNIRSSGFWRDPASEAELSGIENWIYTPGQPPEIYGAGQLFDRICVHLYGAQAGAQMSAYYRLATRVPDVATTEPPPDRAYYRGRRSRYLPRFWEYATALPSYWYYLTLDSHTWAGEPDDRYNASLKGFELSTAELHRRLAHRWHVAADLNARGAERVRSALAAGPKQDTIEDLQFLHSLFRAYQPLLQALEDYHAALADPSAAAAPGLLRSAVADAKTADLLAAKSFPEPVDPAMGEIRSLRQYPRQLAAAAEAWEKSR